MSNSIYDLEELKKQITVPQLLALFSKEVRADGKLACLFHKDTGQPNMQVYSDHTYCFSCGKYVDVFGLAMKLGRMSFDQSVEWLMAKKNILPQTMLVKAPIEYKGAFPYNNAEWFNQQLDKERRQYLYDRLFTDETLDNNLIGYNPMLQAYSIPFWEGIPRQSQIVSMQYRIAPCAENQNKKYFWATGHYKPCVLNQHLINHWLTIVAFGSLDALLGSQLGLPMISASGLNTFASKNKIESIWLAELLRGVQHVFLLPDATVVEHEPVTKIMLNLGAEIKFFPWDAIGKDFNAYCQAGGTAESFVKEILEMLDVTWRDGRMYAVADIHLTNIEQSLRLMCKGQFYESLAYLIIAAQEAGYHSSCVSHALQMMADKAGPGTFDSPFTSEEWREFIFRMGEAWESYHDIKDVLQDWSVRAAARLGSF